MFGLGIYFGGVTYHTVILSQLCCVVGCLGYSYVFYLHVNGINLCNDQKPQCLGGGNFT